MRYSKLMVAAVLGSLGAQMASATPTAEEAAQLGKTLTPFGAIKAGNADGSIPEWTGGLCTPPAGYKPNKGAAGGAPYVDPFATDKPLFKITAADVAKYGDKVDEGTKELFKRNPQLFYMEVYPTRRTACYQNWVYENTIKNVMRPKIVGGAVPGLEGAHAQVPFPIPKTGVEAMWNAAVKYESPSRQTEIDTYLVDSSGSVIQSSLQSVMQQTLFWDNSRTELGDSPYAALIAKSVAPASQVGTMQMRLYNLRPDLKGNPAYSYIPGQRRVRLAPEFSYDGVATTSGGILLYDEINGFDGKMDKFDFKLVGRKEMYVPYNTYKLYLAKDVKAVATPKVVNPEYLRFELHRVWVVEASLKPGERHVHSKKVFLIDEDSWNIVGYYGLDQAGKVHHAEYPLAIQLYDRQEILNQQYILYDFAKSAYLFQNKMDGVGFLGPLNGNWKVPPYPKNYFTPDSMAGMGLR